MKLQASLCPTGHDCATNTGCIISFLNYAIIFGKTTVWSMSKDIQGNTFFWVMCVCLCVLTHFISALSPNSPFILYTVLSAMYDSINVKSYFSVIFP